MSKWIVIPALLLAVMALSACTIVLGPGARFGDGATVGSGKLAEKSFTLEGFTRVELGYGARFEIARADRYSTEVTIDDNALDRLEVVKAGDTLRVGLKDGNYRNVTLRLKITLPELRGLRVDGGATGTVTGLRSAQAFDLTMTGGSILEGDLETGDAKMDLSGGSRATLKGSGKKLHVVASGGSRAELTAFAVNDVNVNANGGSQVTLYLKGRLDAEASGGARVRYSGSPTLGRIIESGGGSVGPR